MDTCNRVGKAPVDWRTIIHSDPSILLGKPVVRGTRLSVDFILRLFGNGWTAQEVLENYPGLTSESLQAVFAYAGEILASVIASIPLHGRFTVIERNRLRQRPLPAT